MSVPVAVVGDRELGVGGDVLHPLAVNVPIGLVLLLLSRRLLPVLPGDGSRRFDVVGLVVLAAAIGTLVVPLVLGHELGWPVWGWVVLTVSALLFALFGLVEWRIAARGGQPLIPGRVLRAPGLLPAPARSSGAALLVTCGAIAAAFVLAAVFAHRTRRAAV
ncbi:hypothetical protein [Kitasatospora sp. MAP5-34]|uniref:hypothetical protein n=1 Tax=Kitasatospora sp. MAP5-34 TaxID=3035102 RepID=UPI002475CFC0|nr:hypothetical protein [Kitasatospora sp. MAP5-34]MDH6574792.1 putative membrane protein [Kitasatospora sp. MAP5-34]